MKGQRERSRRINVERKGLSGQIGGVMRKTTIE